MNCSFSQLEATREGSYMCVSTWLYFVLINALEFLVKFEILVLGTSFISLNICWLPSTFGNSILRSLMFNRFSRRSWSTGACLQNHLVCIIVELDSGSSVDWRAIILVPRAFSLPRERGWRAMAVVCVGCRSSAVRAYYCLRGHHTKKALFVNHGDDCSKIDKRSLLRMFLG